MGVRALVRDAEGARALLPASTRILGGGWRDDTTRATLDGIHTVVFTASGATTSGSTPRSVDHDLVARLARASSACSVRRFVLLSSAGVTQPEHPHNCSFSDVLRWKREGEESLRREGPDYTIVRALGMRDRPGGVRGVRLVQGDRIAFGEDIARVDVAETLARVANFGASWRPRLSDVALGSVTSTTFEIFNDADVAGGEWRTPSVGLALDGARPCAERRRHD